MPKYDILTDYSAISKLDCARRYQLSIAFGVKVRTLNNIYINFGNAVHKFAEHYSKDTDTYPLTPELRRAMKLCKHQKFPEDPTLHSPYLSAITAIAEHIDQQPDHATDINGVPGIEYKFQLPYAETETYNLHICGTIDRIQPLPNDIYAIIDWKSTTRPDRMADFEFTFQLPLYMHVFREYFAHLFNFSGPIVGQIWSIQWKDPAVTIKPGAVIRSEPAVPSLLAGAIDKIIYIYNLGDTIAPPEGLLYKDTCQDCEFRLLCQARDIKVIEDIVRVTPKVEYNPLAHRD